jgi:hypothetical protein
MPLIMDIRPSKQLRTAPFKCKGTLLVKVNIVSIDISNLLSIHPCTVVEAGPKPDKDPHGS